MPVFLFEGRIESGFGHHFLYGLPRLPKLNETDDIPYPIFANKIKEVFVKPVIDNEGKIAGNSAKKASGAHSRSVEEHLGILLSDQ